MPFLFRWLIRHVTFVLCCFAAPVLAAADGERPNLVVIVADDMGYGDAGCYGETNLIPTPNIDRLAAEGTRFTDAYVTAPVCGPSRYGLLLGAYQQKFGVQWNPDTSSKLKGRPETLEDNRIPSSHWMVSQTIESAGYVTGLVGKSNMPCYPQTTFNESMSVMSFGGDYFPMEDGTYDGVDGVRAPRKPGGWNHKEIYWGPKRPGDEYLTDRLGRQSVEFIERHKEEPFFLYLAFNAPHSPLQAKTSHQGNVAHLDSEALQYYGAMLTSMDENVGQVLNALDRFNLAENTLVVFLSDNGPTYAYNVLWPENWPKEILGSTGGLRGYKGQYWDGGIRIPFLMRWPGRIEAGRAFTKPVSAMDIYPTLAAAAGAEVPESTNLDGVDLLPFLDGTSEGEPHEFLHWYSDGQGAIREGKWKLNVCGDVSALFDLEADAAESRDLSDEEPALAERLLAEHRAFIDSLPPVLSPGVRAHPSTVPFDCMELKR